MSLLTRLAMSFSMDKDVVQLRRRSSIKTSCSQTHIRIEGSRLSGYPPQPGCSKSNARELSDRLGGVCRVPLSRSLP
jgi:hypothetical protein